MKSNGRRMRRDIRNNLEVAPTVLMRNDSDMTLEYRQREWRGGGGFP